ncbi:MAG: aspartate aminotransferase [Acidobacteriota bacterium]|nr:aspartate aminotransferase [Acidobacteriota bacterium]
MTPHISARGRAMPASPIRKLMPVAEEAKRRGVKVFHLNIGQPDLETPAVMRARLGRADKVFAYTPSNGTSEYLESLRFYYSRLGLELELDELIATTGGSEALLFAFFACTGDGDDALVVEPYYTNYNSFATMAGVRLVPLRSKGEDGFHLPPREAWERALTPRTRLVLLCNPNNPTGTVYSREELLMVASFCRDHGLFLVADEVYREFVYDGAHSVSALSLGGFEDQVILVDSLSKRYSACGIRLGSLATRNAEVYQAALRMAQGRLSPPGLAQLVASGAVELGKEYFAAIVEEYQGRRDLLFEGLMAIPGVFLRKPEGAFYFIARLPIQDSEDFARYLLAEFSHQQSTVMVAPAPGFYATRGLGNDEVRIAYVLKKEDLTRAVEVFAAGLTAYRKARGLGPIESLQEAAVAPSRRPDFFTPAV